MLIDEQCIRGYMVDNMKNYSLKNGDKIMVVDDGKLYTIGEEHTTDESGQYAISNGCRFLSYYFVLVDRINKNNYWHYYYSNSHICQLLKDYQEINNSHIHICKEKQILGIKNRIQNIVEYGLTMFIRLGNTEISYLYFNIDYNEYRKECKELNISKYYYYDKKNNKLIPFNSKEEYYEYIDGKDN